MNTKVKLITSTLAVLTVLAIPSLTYAAWWKLSTWFKKPAVPPVVRVVQVATTPVVPAPVKTTDQSAEIEKLRKEVEELKKINPEDFTTKSSVQKSTSSISLDSNQTEWSNSVKQLSQVAENLKKSMDTESSQQAPQTQNALPVPIPVINTPPTNATFCNGTNWSRCPVGQDFICPSSGSAYCQLSQQEADLLAKQQRQQLDEQQRQLYVQQQAEQERQRQVNLHAQNLYSEYQNEIAAIDQQILDVKTSYNKSKLDIESQPISSRFLVGQVNNLINQTNQRIEILVNKKEQLRLDYLNRINNLR